MSYLSDFVDRTYRPPTGAQCGYRYTSIRFTVLHVTSVVQADEAAIAYIDQINTWYPKTRVMLVEKRDAGQQDWRLIHRVEEELTGLAPVLGGADSVTEEDEQDQLAEDQGLPSDRVVAVPAVPVVPIVPPVTHQGL